MPVTNEIVARYGNAVLKYCFSILCNFYDAQDAMQETFIKAHYARNAPHPDKYGAWLYKIAYNTCITMLKKRKPTKQLMESDAAYQMEEPFIDPVLTEALKILPPQDRALFYSRAVEDVDYIELEALYNTSANALRKRYMRARNKLRDHLIQIGYLRGENL